MSQYSPQAQRKFGKQLGDFKTPVPESNVLAGDVTRIVYQTEDGSYTVIRVAGENGREYTAVGAMPGVAEGQSVELTGRWERHNEHGLQLKVENFNASLPATPAGIVRYLSSGILRGVGQKTAQKIVDHFGADTLRILDEEPRRLLEIKGFTRNKVESIRHDWKEGDEKRDLRIYLEGLGITPAYFARIYKQYGEKTADVIRQNPYRLASEVRGIGFLHADAIAEKAGIARTDIKRLVAGVTYALEQIRHSGHICIPREEFLPKLAKILNVDETEAERALAAAALADRLDTDTAPDGREMLYDPAFLRCENELPILIRRLLMNEHHAGKNLAKIPQKPNTIFSNEQLAAVQAVSRSAVSIITGGPGVGKTTVISELVRRARAAKISLVLAAPTGRAAKRLAEATDAQASTIHRLLKWDPIQGGFSHSQKNPIPADLFVIDETSMLDLPLSIALFRAIKPGATVVIVGDPDQLPSVGPGNVLNDLIESGICPVSRLTKIFRQGSGSGIIQAAHQVNAGQIPRIPANGELQDFYWIEKEDPAEAADVLVRLIKDRIPARFGFDPVKDVQLLCPMNRGDDGTQAMNKTLQKLLNQNENNSFEHGEREFRMGDKVMQVANNYDKNVFNGDMGYITDIDQHGRTFAVDYDGQTAEYSFDDADQIVHAYAVTVHKSQGCEFPAVVMTLLPGHYMMLQRNLLYTGMTRAKKLMILVGSKKAVSMAVRNSVREPRYSLLLQKLKGMKHG